MEETSIVLSTVVKIFKNFINGLKKSFDGKDHLRKLNKCYMCGESSFMHHCLKCEMDEAYKGWNKKNNL